MLVTCRRIHQISRNHLETCFIEISIMTAPSGISSGNSSSACGGRIDSSSLEHCHTNLFALANIDGIQWRCFVSSQHVPKANIFWDSIITAYLQCLENNILSVWRRVPIVGATKRPVQFEKELWVFWFEEEPYRAIPFTNLTVRCSGSWNNGGLSYECRTLIFKAYHNLIERCLLQKGFARFGRWFILPTDVEILNMPRLAFAFDFFLHGDSRICAIVDIEKRAPVRKVRLDDVNSAPNQGFEVMLSPFGIAAKYIPQTDPPDPRLQQQIPDLINEWASVYPFPPTTDLDASASMIDVIVGSNSDDVRKIQPFFLQSEKAKILYPMHFAYITDLNAFELEIFDYYNNPLSTNPEYDIIFESLFENALLNELKSYFNSPVASSDFSNHQCCECSTIDLNTSKLNNSLTFFHQRCDDLSPFACSSIMSNPSPLTASEYTPGQPDSNICDSPLKSIGTPANPSSTTSTAQSPKSNKLDQPVKEPRFYANDHNYLSYFTKPIRLDHNSSLLNQSILPDHSEDINQSEPYQTLPELSKIKGDDYLRVVSGQLSNKTDPLGAIVLTPPKSNINEDNSALVDLLENSGGNKPISIDTVRSIPSIYRDEILTPPSSERTVQHSPAAPSTPAVEIIQRNYCHHSLQEQHFLNLIDNPVVVEHTATMVPLSTMIKLPSYKPVSRKLQKAILLRFPLDTEIRNESSVCLSTELNLSESVKQQNKSIPAEYFLRADGLVINLSLLDSCLNFFYDTNFDSCPLCACVRSASDSIRGCDMLPFLTGRWHIAPISSCSCAYRASASFSFAPMSGLLVEDEFELIETCSSVVRGPALSSESVDEIRRLLSSPFALKINQYVLSCLRSFALHDNCLTLEQRCSDIYKQNHVIDAIALAYKHGREASTVISNTSAKHYIGGTCEINLHPWLSSGVHVGTDLDVTRLLWQLKPILQQSLQKRHIVAKLWDTMIGPLTLRHFTQLLRTEELPPSSSMSFANKSISRDEMPTQSISDQTCEPLKIPFYTIGSLTFNDKVNAISSSPFILPYWPYQCFEPISGKRNLAFIALLPRLLPDTLSTNQLNCHSSTFFANLSSKYEQLKFGLHRPARFLTENSNTSNFPGLINFEFELIEPTIQSFIVEKLKKFDDIDQWIYGDESSSQKAEQPFSIGLPALSIPTREDLASSSTDCMPGIIIYVISTLCNQDMFSVFFSKFRKAISSLKTAIQDKIVLQIVPLQWILRGDSIQPEILGMLAFNGYSRQPIKFDKIESLKHLTDFRSPCFTDFNDCRMKAKVSKSDENNHNNQQVLSYSPPFILSNPISDSKASLIDLHLSLTADSIHSTCGNLLPSRKILSTTLFCCYCPSSDQRYWIASCCDDSGALLETCVINTNVIDGRSNGSSLSIQQRLAQKEVFQYSRRVGHSRLWDFLMSLVGKLSCPCRLAITRFGRLGQNELRGWSCLFAKRFLKQVTTNFKHRCELCFAYQNPNQIPCILSACLTSFEQHHSFRVFPDAICQRDTNAAGIDRPISSASTTCSCTHIVTFPTSAFVQPKRSFSSQVDPGLNDFDDLLFGGLDMESAELGCLISPPSSPNGVQEVKRSSDQRATKKHSDPCEQTLRYLTDHEENVQLDQQPLAIGLYISTARVHYLPIWARLKRSHRIFKNEDCNFRCNTFKVSLHINVPGAQESDEVLLKNTGNSSTPVSCRHPLDSNVTFVALRYVLEQFHRLSWLVLDEEHQDRHSCLPVNMDILLQLYRSLEALSTTINNSSSNETE